MIGSVINVLQGFRRTSRVGAVLAIGMAGMALSGCVVYPSNGYYGGGYYAAPAVYAPPISVGVGYGWGWGGWGRGCCWGGGWGHGGWR